jgi:hypothetical protein
VRPGTERRLYFEEKPRPELEVIGADARRGVGPRRGEAQDSRIGGAAPSPQGGDHHCRPARAQAGNVVGVRGSSIWPGICTKFVHMGERIVFFICDCTSLVGFPSSGNALEAAEEACPSCGRHWRLIRSAQGWHRALAKGPGREKTADELVIPTL